VYVITLPALRGVAKLSNIFMNKTFEFARLKLPIELKKPLLKAYKHWASNQILEGKKHSKIEFVRYIFNNFLNIKHD
jgi:hypothetical protein